MRIIVLGVLFVMLSITSLVYGQPSKGGDFIINEQQIGIYFSNGERRFLTSGVYDVNRDKTILLEKCDSVYTEQFEVMDSNARTFLCAVKLKYCLEKDGLAKICNELEWIETIQRYKKRFIIPEIKGIVREKMFLINYDSSKLDSLIIQKLSNELLSIIKVDDIQIEIMKE